MGPLQGIKIVDMTSVLMGPFATQALGDTGADVVKIETPEGDVIRQVGPGRHAGMGPMFLSVNRSKRSLVLDLKDGAAGPSCTTRPSPAAAPTTPLSISPAKPASTPVSRQ